MPGPLTRLLGRERRGTTSTLLHPTPDQTSFTPTPVIITSFRAITTIRSLTQAVPIRTLKTNSYISSKCHLLARRAPRYLPLAGPPLPTLSPSRGTLSPTPQARHLILQRLRQQAKENAEVMSSLEAAMLECASAQNRAKACLSLSNGAVGDAQRGAGGPMDTADLPGGDRGGLEVDGSSISSSGVVAGVGGGALGEVRGAPLPGAAGGRQGKGGRR